MKINVDWQGEMEFKNQLPSGHELTVDAAAESGGHNKGPRPMELLLSGLAGCTGIDVVLILKKMKTELEDFAMEVDAERAEEPPRRFTKIHIKYKFKGKKLDERRVERAINLSEKKYCSASNSLNAEITSSYEIESTD
ncbi:MULTISPECIES: OsmC family protein [Halanaerobium]|jgi:putative redox protein|uniref:Putative redox protein n=2 Tax=Halanaerobium TaxID=2330 RepID=A0A2T5RQH3_9FIRM|nr:MULTISPECIES: OsmC family protein [Halanaerobium]PTW02224.1 putative redox protein [Halanaerobium saccharolyticum]PUU88316.1 MAG: putative redox protein [Halanaerobium sp.]RCW62223.1 putative redox protein [Halanaerobium sp. ST460_2HS_T2]TDQ01647.1 putative redox protein [Halanaerobium saccharolyticum]SIR38173.1 putative redox protein [Halanaerobium kushneri]